MRRIALSFFVLLFFKGLTLNAQRKRLGDGFLRMYLDNDFINFYGKGSDRRYTNGVRFDVFYNAGVKDKGFFRGANRMNTASWGFTQVMFTPETLIADTTNPQDYPYSGGLYAVHGFHSADPQKKLNVEMLWVAGVMGRLSLAGETQVAMHSMFDEQRVPKGWESQLPTDLLLNYSVAAEKGVAVNKYFLLAGGGRLSAGTMLNAASFYALVKMGNRVSHFDGLRNQFVGGKKAAFQFYGKPGVDFVLYNALLQGGFFNRRSPLYKEKSDAETGRIPRKVIPNMDLCLLLTFRKIAVSASQKIMAAEFKNMSPNRVGNLSVYVGW